MGRRKWTLEEDNYIIKNFKILSFTEMARHLDCAILTVENRAATLGLNVEHKTARRWTDEEIELLKLMAPKYLNKTIAKKLGRNINEVNKKARTLGIELIFKRPVWKKWKIKFLKENINLLPISRIQEELDVNYYQIMDKLDELGIEYKSTNWTEEEENILKELVLKVYITEIAKVLNRSVGSIRTKASKMGLDYITLKREYTEEELKYIKDNWGKIPITDMARTLHVTRTCVQTQADNMGLKRLGNNPYKKWTPEKIKKLDELSKTKTITELAKYFKTTNTAITTVAYKNNITLIDGKVSWTEEANKELISLSRTCDLSEISKIMNRSTSSIRLQAQRLNIKIMVNKKNKESIWTDENTKELIRLASAGETLLSIANIMHKNDETLAKKARELGIKIKKDEQKPWTEEEIEEFKIKAKSMTLSELQKDFGRTRQSLKNMAKKLNIRLKTDKKSWTEEDYKLLQKLVEEDKLTQKK